MRVLLYKELYMQLHLAGQCVYVSQNMITYLTSQFKKAEIVFHARYLPSTIRMIFTYLCLELSQPKLTPRLRALQQQISRSFLFLEKGTYMVVIHMSIHVEHMSLHYVRLYVTSTRTATLPGFFFLCLFWKQNKTNWILSL